MLCLQFLNFDYFESYNAPLNQNNFMKIITEDLTSKVKANLIVYLSLDAFFSSSMYNFKRRRSCFLQQHSIVQNVENPKIEEINLKMFSHVVWPSDDYLSQSLFCVLFSVCGVN